MRPNTRDRQQIHIEWRLDEDPPDLDEGAIARFVEVAASPPECLGLVRSESDEAILSLAERYGVDPAALLRDLRVLQSIGSHGKG